MKEHKPTTMSKSELARAYGIDISSLRKWLADVPELTLTKGQRILTPKQVALIFEHIGNPMTMNQP